MRTGTGTVQYLIGDHLGSTSLTLNNTGGLVAEIRYKAWGESRYTSGTTPTARHYTGQIEESGLGGLYFYNARWYEPGVGRFLQADTIVPGAGNPQALNRYSYVLNAPLTNNDPSGHEPCETGDGPYCAGGTRNKTRSPNVSQMGNRTLIGGPGCTYDLCRFDYYTVTIQPSIPVWITVAGAAVALVSPPAGAVIAKAGATAQATPLGAFSAGVAVTLDRYGEVYAGPAGGVGKSMPSPVGFSVSGGYLTDRPSVGAGGHEFFESEPASPEAAKDYLSGLNVSGGLGLVTASSGGYSPFAGKHYYGSQHDLVTTAIASLTVSYSFDLGNIGAGWSYVPSEVPNPPN